MAELTVCNHPSTAADPHRWPEIYWITGNERLQGGSLALRRDARDGQWYVTHGYVPEEKVIAGPYPSREAVEMLLAMDMIDV